MLTGNEIRIQIESGGIIIRPYDETCIGPNSYDVHLGDRFVVYWEAIQGQEDIQPSRLYEDREWKEDV